MFRTGAMMAVAVVAAFTPGASAADKIVGMYVHQHWAYKHPYAART